MKRSEMIEIMRHTYEMEGLGAVMRWKDADAILDAIEKAGMKPPPFYGDCAEGSDPITEDWEKEE